jgi:hypothetical protein
MNTSSLSRYNIPCITEGKVITTDYLSSPPTTCPNNKDHQVSISGIRTTTSIPEPKPVTINQVPRNLELGGGGTSNNRVDCHIIRGKADTETDMMISYPYNVCMNSLTIYPTPSNRGGYVTVVLSPNTQVGTVSQSLAAKVDRLILSPSPSVPLPRPGYEIRLGDIYKGIVTSYDHESHTLVFCPPLDDGVLVGSGEVVLTSKIIIQGVRLIGTSPLIFGMSRLIGTGVVAGTQMMIRYANLNKEEQELDIHLDLTY